MAADDCQRGQVALSHKDKHERVQLLVRLPAYCPAAIIPGLNGSSTGDTRYVAESHS